MVGAVSVGNSESRLSHKKDLEICLNGVSKKNFWFVVSGKYNVNISRTSFVAGCDCQAETFRLGGRKQEECKHIKQCKKFLDVVKWR